MLPGQAVSEVTAPQVAAGCGSLASAGAAVWCGMSAAADALFGVPLQVLFAAAAGAFGAMTYLGQMGLLKLIAASVFYTAIGAFTVPLAMHLLGAPHAAAAGVALLISGGLPFAMPVVRQRLPELIGKLFDKLTGGAK